MRKYVLKRVLASIPTVFIVILLNFTILHVVPGDPAIIYAGGSAPPGYIEKVREELGLNKPLHEQLVIYIAKLLRGDFGYSTSRSEPVLQVIVGSLPATLLLMAVSMAISLAAGIFLGVISSMKPYSRTDALTTVGSLTIYSMPSFWVGMLSILAFAVHLHIFPAQGMYEPGLSGLAKMTSILWHLVLPASIIALEQLALYYRLTRASMLEVLREDYIVTAWSKGLTSRSVYFKHALRNALLPIITYTGLRLRLFFTGSIVLETVFAWPGVGRLTFIAILERDYWLLMSIFTIVSVITIVANLIADLLYAYVDPRIRHK